MKNTHSIYNAQSLFFIFGLSYFVSGLFRLIFSPEAPFTMQMQDTYFVLSAAFISFSIAGFFLVLAGIYRVVKHFNLRTNYKLELLHFLLTAAPIIGILSLTLVQKEFINNRNYAFDGSYRSPPIEINAVITLLALLIAFAQVIFVINIISSILKRKAKNKDI